MTPLLRNIIGSLAVAGIMAGLGGLTIAGRTQADVQALKDAQPALDERLRGVESELAGLKAAVTTRADAEEQFREIQNKAFENLDKKLQRLIEGD